MLIEKLSYLIDGLMLMAMKSKKMKYKKLWMT